MQGTKFLHWMGSVILATASFTLHAETLQPDPAWQQGKLKNGFSWQVLSTPQRPNDSVELRLVVNSGSVNESDAQAGYSHLLTRVALVHNTAISTAQQRELWQQSINKQRALSPAITSYDYTQYNLSLPANRPDLMKDALQWLAATAGNMAINQQVVNTADTASDPTSTWPPTPDSAWWNYRLKGTLLQAHDPLTSASTPVNVARLNDFYHQWYTPDAMTLYVVGNVDSRSLAESITKTFSGLKGQRSTPAPMVVLPPLSGQAVNLQDSHRASDRLSLIWDMPWTPITDSQTLQQYWLSDLAREVLYWHLQPQQEAKTPPDALYGLDCRVFYQRAQCGLSIDTAGDNLSRQLQKVASDFVALRDNGLSQSAFEQLITAKTAELNTLYATYARTGTQMLIAQRLRSQQNNVIDISPEQYQHLRQAFLTGLTVDTLNQQLRQLLSQPLTLVLSQPAGETTVPAQSLRAQFDAIVSPTQNDSSTTSDAATPAQQ